MDDAAAVEDEDLLRDLQRELGRLLHQDDAQRLLGDQALHSREERVGDDGGQPLERLVEQEQRGIAHEGATDGEHLLLTAGEGHAHLATARSQAREELVDSLERPAAGSRGDPEIFLERERGEDVARLGHVADAEPRALVHGQARDGLATVLDAAGVEGRVTHDGGEECGLAHPVPAQDGERAALGQREIHVLQHHGGPVARAHGREREAVSHAVPRGRPAARADRRRSRGACPRTGPRPGPVR